MEFENKNNSKNYLIVVVGFLVGLILMYAIIHFFPDLFTTTTTKLEKDVTVTDKGIADAVEKVYDSTVVVTTYVNGKAYGSGTGFVYQKKDGKAYILTNNHVIKSGDKVYVTFTNGETIETEIIGSDVYSDVGVVAVDADKVISVANLGKSEDVRIGDTVFAVGAPLDDAYSWTVTRGILSGKDRLVSVKSSDTTTNDEIVMSVLQTDAAINNGNSGGPLANSNGEVIGITSLKLASSTIEGMGFAIPIEDALDYAEKIVNKETIVRPYIGVSMLNLSTLYQQYYSTIVKLNLTGGVVIADVVDGTPAKKAGLTKGDIIVAVDGNEVKSIAYFRYQLYKHKVGDEVEITFYRGEEKKTAKVSLISNAEKN
ncbi:MAG: trypsin-like peptidase domain-containing protein [Bacilli bacterium]|nr:trypsin-like peptidase domain-containing protein [Bacilli bacterium]